jgi:cobalamin transport system ATP-binding protein
VSAIEVRGLSVRAGSATLISEVDLVVEPGTWCTVIGPNGAGKTTLVETVAGLRRAAAGSVAVFDEPVGTMGERARATRIALVPQHPVVPPGMSVEDYVALGRTAYHGVLRAPSADDRRVVGSVIDRLELAALAARDVATLSGGERQRAVLARALAQSTRVVVLDEPTTGLDLRHQVTLLEILRAEVAECGLCVLATLHDLTLAGQFADRLVLMDHGRVVADGPSGEVVRSEALARSYQMDLRVVEVDGADVVVPAHRGLTPG